LKRVTELETKKETSLEKNQTYLQNPPRVQPPPATSPVPPVKNNPKGKDDVKEGKEQSSEEKEYTFFSDPFGLKRQHTELDLKKQRLDLRIKQLESFESRLMKEKDMLRARVEEFSKWQEKLMALESEIEKRRQDVMKQETMVLNKRPHSPSIQITSGKKDSQRDVEADIPPSDDETLETIPQSAAIIQRGILKQINAQFVDLLGYPLEEIVEKSYFDFIALEGLADVEKYYLDRLKGDSVSVYRTVFSTKDNKKIPVEVSIKQTIYNGEKAEIVIITSLNTGSV
jgi:PAS domain S-box-containing protein